MGTKSNKSAKAVIRVQGGLGNQMFQYAYAYALGKRNNTEFLLDISTFNRYKERNNKLSDFSKIPPYATLNEIPFYERIGAFRRKFYLTKRLRSLFQRLNPRDYREKSKGFDPNFTHIKNGYIVGYFQTEKYFKKYEDDIKGIFQFTKNVSETVKKYISDNHLNLDERVAISVRRGDFKTETNHYLIPFEFYIEAYQQHFPDKDIIVFSDDIDRCKRKFKQPNVIFSDSLGAIEQLCLMSKCKNFIISNSTFSRWGAYLSSRRDKKVVRPQLAFDQIKKGKAYMQDHYPGERLAHPWGLH